MNAQPTRRIVGGRAPMVRPFPRPGLLVEVAYEELEIATETSGPAHCHSALGELPRPWDPGTCTDAALRRELWDWLDAVVAWHNHEHVWDVHAAIPTCWPHHPHLVHEIAVLADQRLRAGQAFTSDLLEDWHRYSLPAFTERLRTHVRDHCNETHQPWPAQGRYTRHQAAASGNDRSDCFEADAGPRA